MGKAQKASEHEVVVLEPPMGRKGSSLKERPHACSCLGTVHEVVVIKILNVIVV